MDMPVCVCKLSYLSINLHKHVPKSNSVDPFHVGRSFFEYNTFKCKICFSIDSSLMKLKSMDGLTKIQMPDLKSGSSKTFRTRFQPIRITSRAILKGCSPNESKIPENKMQIWTDRDLVA